MQTTNSARSAEFEGYTYGENDPVITEMMLYTPKLPAMVPYCCACEVEVEDVVKRDYLRPVRMLLSTLTSTDPEPLTSVAPGKPSLCYRMGNSV